MTNLKISLLTLGLSLVLPIAVKAQTTDICAAAGAQPTSAETCFSPQESCERRLVALFCSARSTIDIAIYNLTMQEFAEALRSVKAKGVKIRIVADKSMAETQRSLVSKLAAEGFDVKIGATGERGIMHHKFSIVDGRLLQTGSFNYTFTAARNSAENQIYLTDSKVVARFQGEFEKIYRAGLSPDVLQPKAKTPQP